MTLPAGTAIGKYIVKHMLAEGGMAELYLCAVQGPAGFEKEVVIKRIRSFMSADPNFVSMFIDEARMASQINHGNVVQIFDFDKHEDSYYLAMEYVAGQSLLGIRRRAAERMMPMAPAMSAHICMEVARGLSAAHRLSLNGQLVGIVHRDVTPHNILVSMDGAVKLTDFGIAKTAAKHTVPGTLKGKLSYMSPEQALGEQVDARTDLFALGIVLWESLTGARLFQGDSEMSIVKAVLNSMIAPPSRINPDVPPELDAIALKALARDVGLRFQTASEFERALAQFKLKQEDAVDEAVVAEYMGKLFGQNVVSEAPDLVAPEMLEHTQRRVVEAPIAPVRNEILYSPTSEFVSGATYIISSAPVERALPSAAETANPTASGVFPEPSVAEEMIVDVSDESPRKTLRLEAVTGFLASKVSGRRIPSWFWGLAVIALIFLMMGLAFQARNEKEKNKEDTRKPRDVENVPMAVVEKIPTPPAREPAPVPTSAPVPVAAAEPPLVAKTEPVPPPAAEAVKVQEKPRPIQSNAKSPSESRRQAKRVEGVLVIRASPYAVLYIDGRKFGEIEESKQYIKLSAGRHSLRLVHPTRTKNEVIQIRPGEKYEMAFFPKDASLAN